MMLQTVDTTEVWQDALLVNLSVDFEDVAQLGEMASKLKNMGGYKQVRPSPKITSEDEEFSSDGDEESDEMDLNILIGMGPKIMFHDVAAGVTVNANHFELTYDGEKYRFTHGNVNPPQRRRKQQQLPRQFTTKGGLNSVPTRSSAHMLIPGVMLQKEEPLNVWHDVDTMDVYIEFDGAGWSQACNDLMRGLEAQGYVDVSRG
ncbi:unnamed protein product, partial [Mesorhabditis belari]|uniref:Uncharacterized protein n=1 Tax=Mesorhabditis belari TaxID=2138241 RepID=A0AAF3EHT7_9BILA